MHLNIVSVVFHFLHYKSSADRCTRTYLVSSISNFRYYKPSASHAENFSSGKNAHLFLPVVLLRPITGFHTFRFFISSEKHFAGEHLVQTAFISTSANFLGYARRSLSVEATVTLMRMYWDTPSPATGIFLGTGLNNHDFAKEQVCCGIISSTIEVLKFWVVTWF